MSKFKGKLTDNGAKLTKAKLRETALNLMEEARVCEFFCGSGVSYNAVWHRAKKYIGIDIKKINDERHTIAADCESAAKSIINVNEYNIFDIDAYGSPYGVLSIICNRINHGYRKICFVITDGINIDLKMGNVCRGLLKFTGIKHRKMKGAYFLHEQFIKITVNSIARKLNGNVVKFKIATGKTGASMKYYFFIIQELHKNDRVL